jgi:DNA polymerase III gamma/tau subunit
MAERRKSMSLITQYRPQKFDEVYGQDAVVNSLASAVENKSSQCFLLSGPSGCGKTTLARIAAHELGCDDLGIEEIDAATHTGVEDMREVQSRVQFRPFGTSPVRAIIVDEAHSLSGKAWESLLKITEEPPEDVYWFFCTTQPDKIIKTIQTRCVHLRLKELGKNTLTDLINGIAEAEGIKLIADVRQVIIARAEGSARQALVNLATCRDAASREEAAELLQEVQQSDAIALLRLLQGGNATWASAMKIIDQMNGANPEGVRIQAVNYFAKCAKGAKSDREAAFFLQLLENFKGVYSASEGNAQLLSSIGLCIFHE